MVDQIREGEVVDALEQYWQTRRTMLGEAQFAWLADLAGGPENLTAINGACVTFLEAHPKFFERGFYASPGLAALQVGILIGQSLRQEAAIAE